MNTTTTKAAWRNKETGEMQYDWDAINEAAKRHSIVPDELKDWVFDNVTDDLTAKELLAAYFEWRDFYKEAVLVFECLEHCALEAGIGSDNMQMTLSLSVSLVDGEPRSQRLLVDLERSGAQLTRTKETVTARVDYASAARFQQLCEFGDFLIDSEVK